MEKRTMTVKETAEYLGVHPDTIYLMAKEGELPHIRMRSKILFFQQAIDSWVADQQKRSQTQEKKGE